MILCHHSWSFLIRHPKLLICNLNYMDLNQIQIELWKKGLRRAQHDTTSPCKPGRVEQVYIKSKCGHCILLDTIMCWIQQEKVICWTHYILDICVVLTSLSFKNGFKIKILYTFDIWKISQYGSLLDPSSNSDILPFLALFFLNWISYINNSNFLKDIFIRNSFCLKTFPTSNEQ